MFGMDMIINGLKEKSSGQIVFSQIWLEIYSIDGQIISIKRWKLWRYTYFVHQTSNPI